MKPCAQLYTANTDLIKVTVTVITTMTDTVTVTVTVKVTWNETQMETKTELIVKARGTDKMSSKWVIGCLGTLIALLMVFDGLNRFLIYPWSR